MSFIKFCFLTLSLLAPFMSTGHGYWIELEGTHKVAAPVTIKLVYGDYPDGERMSGKFLDKMKDIKVYVQQPDGEKQQIAMMQRDSFWVGTFTPGSAAIYEVIGINDEREVQDWTKHKLGITRPIQYLKACYSIGRQAAEPAASLPLDVELKQAAKGSYAITVRQNGRTVPAQKLSISAFGSEAQQLITDANGKARVELKKPGLYVLSIDWIDNTPGTFRDKSYENVRHRLDYSIYHPQ